MAQAITVIHIVGGKRNLRETGEELFGHVRKEYGGLHNRHSILPNGMPAHLCAELVHELRLIAQQDRAFAYHLFGLRFQQARRVLPLLKIKVPLLQLHRHGTTAGPGNVNCRRSRSWTY